MSTLLVILLAFGAGEPTMVPVAPGEELAAYDAGTGRPVVLVPGLSGCVYGYREVAALLQERGFRTIGIEPLALGRSGRPADADYTLTAQADRLASVMESMEITDALVVAQGVGFSMALRLALRHPERVAALVSIEGGPAESAATPTVRSGLKLAKLVAKVTGTTLLRDHFKGDLEKSSGDASWVDRRTLNWYFRGPGADIDGTLNAFIAMTEQPEPEPITPRLAEIDRSVLVLVGDSDHVGALEPEETAALQNGLRNVTFRTVAGAGHFIFEEQPQAVADAVMAFAAATVESTAP